jgi:hypothetical protein
MGHNKPLGLIFDSDVADDSNLEIKECIFVASVSELISFSSKSKNYEQ